PVGASNTNEEMGGGRTNVRRGGYKFADEFVTLQGNIEARPIVQEKLDALVVVILQKDIKSLIAANTYFELGRLEQDIENLRLLLSPGMVAGSAPVVFEPNRV